jgi:hypothetical protein
MKKCSYCGAEYPDDAVVCAFDKTSLDNPPPSLSFRWSAFPWTLLLSWGGLVFSIFVNVSIVHGCLPLFFTHHNLGPGMIFWFISLFSTAGLTFFIGIPCAILAIKKGRRRVGWLGVVLALTPAPLGLTLVKIAMHLNGLQFD